MRWKSKKGKRGRYTRRTFLFLPKLIKGEWRWLEIANINSDNWLGASGTVWRDDLSWGKDVE